MAEDAVPAVTRQIRAAYAAGAPTWMDGPEAVYACLADALVDQCPVPVEGAAVLDLGSGTGVATRALLARGSRPVGYDLTWEMLAQRRSERPAGVTGDARALPFPDATFDAVVGACLINHLEPVDPMRECVRVLRPGGGLVLSSFPNDRPHPLKAVVEEVLFDHGWEPPAWYAEMRATIAAVTGDADSLAGAARAAGVTEVDAGVVDIEAGVDDVGRLLAWRLSMPHTIGFMDALDPGARQALVDDAVARAAALGPSPSAIPLLVLRGRAP